MEVHRGLPQGDIRDPVPGQDQKENLRYEKGEIDLPHLLMRCSPQNSEGNGFPPIYYFILDVTHTIFPSFFRGLNNSKSFIVKGRSFLKMISQHHLFVD
jgi:hypothetical protein